MDNILVEKLFNMNKLVMIGLLALVCLVLLTFFPSLNTGFLLDDWHYIGTGGSMALPEYLRTWLDPSTQVLWYRPVQGIVGRIEYVVFGSNFASYHLIQVLLHLVNSILLFAVVQKISKRWRLALLTSLFYVGLPAYSWAVIWISVVDPLMTLFYLFATWFWLAYLEDSLRSARFLAYGAFVLALLTKETAITLPVALFLIDKLLIKRNSGTKQYLLEYSPFAIMTLPYLIIEWNIQSKGWFSTGAGYGVGLHVIRNLIDYLATLTFPWGIETSWNYVSLGIFALAIILFTVTFRTWRFAFLGLFACLTILPAAGFGLAGLQPRYLYLPMVIMAVALALLVEWIIHLSRHRSWMAFAVSLPIVFVLIVNGLGVGDASASFAEQSRQERVPFRDISQRHPVFPPDTYLYFIYPHHLLSGNLAGKFFLHYGSIVNVETTNTEQPARLRDHNVSFVYFTDETGQTVEVPVDKQAPTTTSMQLPVDFAESIRLEGYEVTSTTLKAGDKLIVLLYWRASGSIPKDYTVFAHLVNDKGVVVAGYDSQPKQGGAPTSTWLTNELIVDSIIMPITPDVPPDSGYHLEVGWYYLPTMARLGILNAPEQANTDALTIEPFSVVE